MTALADGALRQQHQGPRHRMPDAALPYSPELRVPYGPSDQSCQGHGARLPGSAARRRTQPDSDQLAFIKSYYRQISQVLVLTRR